MYIINKVVEDYEGTWSNALMYETDLSRAIEIANELQEAIVSLKRIYVDIKQRASIELKKSFPLYGDFSIEFEEQLKNVTLGDKESYFDKEERLLKEMTDKELNDTEKFLYRVSYMNSMCRLMYFDVQKITAAKEVFEKAKNNEDSYKIEYSTKEDSKKHSALFEKFPDE